MTSFAYTVIIPHKNIPDLLLRCLNSIPDRIDVQIIVIDDNSTFKPEEYIFKSATIKYIYLEESRGAGYARNAGLAEAQGKWLLFADADDFFTEKAFTAFDSCFLDVEDLIYFRSISKYSETLLPADRHSYIMDIFDNYKNNPSEYAKNVVKYRVVGPVAKMFKKELIDKYNICFDEVFAGNDVMFSIKSAYYAGKSIKILEDIVYCMTTREGSLTQTRDFSVFQCRYNVVLTANTFLKKNNQAKYRFTLLGDVVKSVRYGISKPFLLTYSAIKTGNNIFVNCFSKLIGNK